MLECLQPRVSPQQTASTELCKVFGSHISGLHCLASKEPPMDCCLGGRAAAHISKFGKCLQGNAMKSSQTITCYGTQGAKDSDAGSLQDKPAIIANDFIAFTADCPWPSKQLLLYMQTGSSNHP